VFNDPDPVDEVTGPSDKVKSDPMASQSMRRCGRCRGPCRGDHSLDGDSDLKDKQNLASKTRLGAAESGSDKSLTSLTPP
jgi:hypothetical protein